MKKSGRKRNPRQSRQRYLERTSPKDDHQRVHGYRIRRAGSLPLHFVQRSTRRALVATGAAHPGSCWYEWGIRCKNGGGGHAMCKQRMAAHGCCGGTGAGGAAGKSRRCRFTRHLKELAIGGS
jgi:hypothetical protein